MTRIQFSRIKPNPIKHLSPADWVLELNRPSLIRFPHDPKDIMSLNLEEDSSIFFRSIELQAHLQ